MAEIPGSVTPCYWGNILLLDFFFVFTWLVMSIFAIVANFGYFEKNSNGKPVKIHCFQLNISLMYRQL